MAILLFSVTGNVESLAREYAFYWILDEVMWLLVN
ncbi:hypothetical protein Misp06_00165 [Microbulbifer sp. NBRC 101763]